MHQIILWMVSKNGSSQSNEVNVVLIVCTENLFLNISHSRGRCSMSLGTQVTHVLQQCACGGGTFHINVIFFFQITNSTSLL